MMTNKMNHPLTDEMIDEIAEQYNPYDEDLRAAADWQLEQVIDWLKDELDYDPHLLLDLKEAMRPQQQEDKPMTDDMRSVANKAITEARAMMDTLVSDGSIDRQTYYDLMGEFEETMLPEENN